MKADDFFNEAEKAQISEAIKEVEKKTAGEVAVMVVDESDTYPEGQLLAGLLPGGLLALLVTDYWFADSLWIFIPAAALFAILFGWLSGLIPPLKRFFTPRSRLESRVQERALRAFYEKGLYRTREATGVLFFLSLFEHKVWVLADRGIYQKIPEAELQAFAWDMAKGVKSHRAAEVLCREIRKVGEILARHFPIRPDDINELSDRVLTE